MGGWGLSAVFSYIYPVPEGPGTAWDSREAGNSDQMECFQWFTGRLAVRQVLAKLQSYEVTKVAKEALKQLNGSSG